MPGKVLLIFPKLDDVKEFHHIPVSSLSLAAPLVQMGIESEILDERVDDFSRLPEFLKNVSIVGVTMFSGYQTCRGYEILKQVKHHDQDIVTIVGGPHPTALPDQTLESEYVDYVVTGFAEEAFSMLAADILQNGIQKKHIPDVYSSKYTIGEGFAHKKLLKEKTWYPLPYEKIDLKKYINQETKRIMYIAHYGCPGQCTFCATSETRKWFPKPLNIIKKDLSTLYNLFPFEQLCFFDATLFTKKERVLQILSCLNRYKNVKWLADGRAIELVKYSKDELVDIQETAGGLIALVVGLESGSKRVAEGIMKKGKNHIENFKSVMEKTFQAGIQVYSGLIFGVPGETCDDLEQTIQYLREIRKINPKFRISSTFFKPLPGTELFALLHKKGYIKEKSLADWAAKGGLNHYKYNEWTELPWIDELDRYKKLYEQFQAENKDILI